MPLSEAAAPSAGAQPRGRGGRQALAAQTGATSIIWKVPAAVTCDSRAHQVRKLARLQAKLKLPELQTTAAGLAKAAENKVLGLLAALWIQTGKPQARFQGVFDARINGGSRSLSLQHPGLRKLPVANVIGWPVLVVQ